MVLTLDLNYDVIPPKKSTAPYLVFLHGAGGDKTQWYNQQLFFQQLGWGVLSLCLPGRGGSPNIPLTTITEYANVVTAFLISLDLTNVTLVGHSMGGAISMQIILNFDPSFIKRIVLIGTGAKLRVAPVFFDLIREDFDKYLKMAGEFMFPMDTPLKIKEQYGQVIQRNGENVLIKDFKACDQFDILAKLKKIQVPSLIICGEGDRMTPVKYSKFLNKNLGGNSQLEIIPKTGHYVYQTAPNVVNKIIQQFHER